MENLEKRAAYLRGLADGMDVTTKEGHLIRELLSFLEEMSEQLTQIHMRIDEQEQYIEAIDEDLTEVEFDLYDAAEEVCEDEEDEDEDCEDCDCIEEIYMDQE